MTCRSGRSRSLLRTSPMPCPRRPAPMPDKAAPYADDVRAALGPPVEDFNPETKQFERVQHADPVRVVEDAFNIMPLALLVADGYSYTKGDMALIAVDALRAAGFAVVWAG